MGCGKMKKLSIITTLYNSARYLPKCLDSLINQDLSKDEYEIIVVNDGSPDNSESIAKEYAGYNNNIRILSQPNKGLAGARNTGIRSAVGKYLYFVDPDDYILENSLGSLINRMDRDNLDILRFGYSEVDENYRPTKSCKHPEQPDYSPGIMDGQTFMGRRLGIACYVWTYLFRTRLVTDNNLFFTEGVYYDDTTWLPQVLRLAKRVDSIDFKRHFYVIRNESLVRSSNSSAVFKRIEGQKSLIQELRRQFSTVDNQDAFFWYKRMIAHCTISLLSLVASKNKDDIDSCVSFIKKSRILPLSMRRLRFKNCIKVSIINLSPSLFCLLFK